MGIANAIPDSFTPRRFSKAITATTSTAISVRCPFIAGNAEARLATPAATDTATVSV